MMCHDVTPKALIGPPTILLMPRQGGAHFLHAQWEASGHYGVAGIQLEWVIHVHIDACRGPDVCMLVPEESALSPACTRNAPTD